MSKILVFIGLLCISLTSCAPTNEAKKGWGYKYETQQPLYKQNAYSNSPEEYRKESRHERGPSYQTKNGGYIYSNPEGYKQMPSYDGRSKKGYYTAPTEEYGMKESMSYPRVPYPSNNGQSYKPKPYYNTPAAARCDETVKAYSSLLERNTVYPELIGSAHTLTCPIVSEALKAELLCGIDPSKTTGDIVIYSAFISVSSSEKINLLCLKIVLKNDNKWLKKVDADIVWHGKCFLDRHNQVTELQLSHDVTIEFTPGSAVTTKVTSEDVTYYQLDLPPLSDPSYSWFTISPDQLLTSTNINLFESFSQAPQPQIPDYCPDPSKLSSSFANVNFFNLDAVYLYKPSENDITLHEDFNKLVGLDTKVNSETLDLTKCSASFWKDFEYMDSIRAVHIGKNKPTPPTASTVSLSRADKLPAPFDSMCDKTLRDLTTLKGMDSNRFDLNENLLEYHQSGITTYQSPITSRFGILSVTNLETSESCNSYPDLSFKCTYEDKYILNGACYSKIAFGEKCDIDGSPHNRYCLSDYCKMNDIGNGGGYTCGCQSDEFWDYTQLKCLYTCEVSVCDYVFADANTALTHRWFTDRNGLDIKADASYNLIDYEQLTIVNGTYKSAVPITYISSASQFVNDFVSFPDKSTIGDTYLVYPPSNPGFTISLWAKDLEPLEIGESRSFMQFKQYGGDYITFGYQMGTSGYELFFSIACTISAKAIVLDLTIWNHFYIAYAPTTQTSSFYFREVYLGATYNVGALDTTNGQTEVTAGYDAIKNTKLTGILYDLRIHNRPISIGEILALGPE